jgi:hypothetical protein
MPMVKIADPGSEKATGNPEMSALIITISSRAKK